MSHLRASCEYAAVKLDDYDAKLKTIDRKINEITKLQDILSSPQNSMTEMKVEVETMEQWTRLSNIEIRGVPVFKDENLFAVVEKIGIATGYPIQRSQLNYISRVPTYSKEKNIVMSFSNRYVKEEFIAAARAFGELKGSDIGFYNKSQRIFVNDHLNPASKIILSSEAESQCSRIQL